VLVLARNSFYVGARGIARRTVTGAARLIAFSPISSA
jgi:hypothetical protein